MISTKQTRVIVGMSGGVDSSVAALMLKREGYHVEALFMKNWEEDDDTHRCPVEQDLIDAQSVCLKLGIRLHTINFSTEYWDNVFTYFLEEYKAGRTPNPDIMCNKEIKFKAFLDHATKLGANYIATGHYAQCQKYNNQYYLLKGTDINKDQSYFLYTLNQSQLEKTLFPLGKLTKPEVRNIAKKIGFKNHAKKDSTGICFIGERKFKTFLNKYIPSQPGDIKTTDGTIIGKHDGLMFYTLGQREGIGIGGKKNALEKPWYVLDKDLKHNILLIGQGHDHPLLLKKHLSAAQLHWVSGHPPCVPHNCKTKTRYRQSDQECTIESIENNTAYVTFLNEQRAITPGQSVVFYDDDICLGGGVIE